MQNLQNKKKNADFLVKKIFVAKIFSPFYFFMGLKFLKKLSMVPKLKISYLMTTQIYFFFNKLAYIKKTFIHKFHQFLSRNLSTFIKNSSEQKTLRISQGTRMNFFRFFRTIFGFFEIWPFLKKSKMAPKILKKFIRVPRLILSIFCMYELFMKVDSFREKNHPSLKKRFLAG